ncbi:hypothetical protein ACO2Q2_15765 [Dyella sp. KRB-257]|uniref:hypothetical protein n=1 Tax=Dyella sp. KRB-257 TaxID=3400915 RepID=UPI003C0ECE63
MTAVLDGGATTATPDVKRSDDAHAANAKDGLNLTLAAMLAGATETSPQAARETVATVLAEAALMLVRAISSMLRGTPPEIVTAALPTNVELRGGPLAARPA